MTALRSALGYRSTPLRGFVLNAASRLRGFGCWRYTMTQGCATLRPGLS
ncbi:MAG: hypothetical protein ABSG67_18285 [Thermoguttaceae bacterium]